MATKPEKWTHTHKKDEPLQPGHFCNVIILSGSAYSEARSSSMMFDGSQSTSCVGFFFIFKNFVMNVKTDSCKGITLRTQIFVIIMCR